MNELILSDLEAAFGVRVSGIRPVSGGYLNKKWRAATDAGEILIKQYSHERFNRRKLDDIESALERQRILFEAGIPCPRVWKTGERIIRRPSEKLDYMVMDFLPGASVGPDTVSVVQMESLGEVCARMHEQFRRLPSDGVKGYPINRQRLVDALHGTVRRSEEEEKKASGAYREALTKARIWAETMDFSFLDRLETSVAHEDFTPDNMLFEETGVRAILDFDRNQFSFPLHDVGRALLSLAYHDERMDEERVGAFQRGYVRYGRLTDGDIQAALTLTALIEIPWWIQPGCFEENSPKMRRFTDEMLFLVSNLSKFGRR